MSRIKRNTVEYFPHLVNEGKTVYILQQHYGNDGYAAWFKLLSELCRSEDHFIDCNNEETWQYLIAKLMISEQTATEILNLLAKLGNIDAELWDTHVIWCDSLVENLREVYRKRGREVPQKPLTETFLRQFSDNSPQKRDNGHQPAAEIPQSKVEESKVENNSLRDFQSISQEMNQLTNNNQKVGFLVNVFKTLHSSAPKGDFDDLGGRIAAMAKSCSYDFDYLLSKIWEAGAKPITGSHLNYIQGILRGSNNGNGKNRSRTNFNFVAREDDPHSGEIPPGTISEAGTQQMGVDGQWHELRELQL